MQNLTKEEINALIDKADNDKKGYLVINNQQVTDDDILEFDLTQCDQVVRGKIPVLNRVNENFSRLLSYTISVMLNKDIVIKSEILESKFSDFSDSFDGSYLINLVEIPPFWGTAFFIFDYSFVYYLTENYFGGMDDVEFKNHSKITSIETELFRIVLENFFKDYVESWKVVLDIKCNILNSYTIGEDGNNSLSNLISFREKFILNRFNILFNNHDVRLDVLIPSSMIDIIKNVLVGSSGCTNNKFNNKNKGKNYLKLINNVMNISMELKSDLVKKSISLQEAKSIKTNDFIPIDIPEKFKLTSNAVPLFEAEMGVYNGNLSLKILKKCID